MAANPRLSNKTMTLLAAAPDAVQRLAMNTAAGRNPNVTFAFTELKVPRGTHPHPPHTDLQEVRSSITVEFSGTPWGKISAHLFNDGTIKTAARMHQEINARRAQDRLLETEESKFPELRQTAVRIQAYERMMQRIMNARNSSASIMSKQIEKSNAQQEYQLFLHAQAQARQLQAQLRAQAQAQARSDARPHGDGRSRGRR